MEYLQKLVWYFPLLPWVAAETKLFVYTVSPESRDLTASFTSQLRTIGGSFINIYWDLKIFIYAMVSFHYFTGMMHQRLMHPLADFTWQLSKFSSFKQFMWQANQVNFISFSYLLANIILYYLTYNQIVEHLSPMWRFYNKWATHPLQSISNIKFKAIVK